MTTFGEALCYGLCWAAANGLASAHPDKNNAVASTTPAFTNNRVANVVGVNFCGDKVGFTVLAPIIFTGGAWRLNNSYPCSPSSTRSSLFDSGGTKFYGGHCGSDIFFHILIEAKCCTSTCIERSTFEALRHPLGRATQCCDGINILLGGYYSGTRDCSQLEKPGLLCS